MDFFISYTKVDLTWAEWVDWQLRDAKYTTIIQSRDFVPGNNFPLEMHRAIKDADRLIAILSPDYLTSDFAQLEWSAVLAKDPSGGSLIPVRVRECDVRGILGPIVYIDMVELEEQDARRKLLEGIKAALSKGIMVPEKPKIFPRQPSRPQRAKVNFPGCMQPVIDAYCRWAIMQPLVDNRYFGKDYQVEPSDLHSVILRKIDTDNGQGVRAIRSAHSPISFIRLSEEMKDSISNWPESVTIILGEAGVGKTVTCKYLRQYLAKAAPKPFAVPIFVPLGAWDYRKPFRKFIDNQIGTGDFDELAEAVVNTGSCLLLILDGLNELKPDKLKTARKFVQKLMNQQYSFVIMTSRPVAEVEHIWPGENARFFELLRWNKGQLQEYLKQNNMSGIWESLNRMPVGVRKCFQLPLLAALILTRLDSNQHLPELKTVGEVFSYALELLLKDELQKNLILSLEIKNLKGDPVFYLSKLAYNMTEKKLVSTEGKALEKILSKTDKLHFKNFLIYLLNSGILRCPDSTASIDPRHSDDDCRRMKISFLHQAFQEYLTAQRFLQPWSPKLPDDVSRDAFWREVPLYIVQSMDNLKSQKSFAENFLYRGDYLTCARLVPEISDSASASKIRRATIEKLLKNIEQPSHYSHAIETFENLNQYGINALRECLIDETRLSQTFAEAEAHLIQLPRANANDALWCRLGRSVYFLGELGDAWLASHLYRKLRNILSLHLLYHIGEALLTLARGAEPNTNQKRIICDTAEELDRLSRDDPVVIGYALAALRELGAEPKQQIDTAEKLRDFLDIRTNISRPYFRDEFWQRAHGVEAFAELAVPQVCSKVLKNIWEKEDEADYGAHKDQGYRLVQSSILKAALRSCDLWPGQRENYKDLLEFVFHSKRAGENDYVCKHLEHILLKWFSGPENTEWIADWRNAKNLGGKSIRSTLSNVIWQH